MEQPSKINYHEHESEESWFNKLFGNDLQIIAKKHKNNHKLTPEEFAIDLIVNKKIFAKKLFSLQIVKILKEQQAPESKDYERAFLELTIQIIASKPDRYLSKNELNIIKSYGIPQKEFETLIEKMRAKARLRETKKEKAD